MKTIESLTSDKKTLKEELEAANKKIQLLETQRKGCQSASPVSVRSESVLQCLMFDSDAEAAKVRPRADEQRLRESELEREHHQKLVKEYGRLQQR